MTWIAVKIEVLARYGCNLLSPVPSLTAARAPARRILVAREGESVLASQAQDVIETDTDKLQEMVTRLIRRWRSLPETRRQDILSRAAVDTFAVLVIVGGLVAFLGMRIGATAAFWVVLVMAALGVSGAFLAGRRQRSRVVWGWLCFLLPIIGLVVLLVIPDEAWRDPSA
jgi:hypothetical protein